jgi:hypothetical protein
MLVDSTGFQRVGHEALGEVFTASVLGLPLTFVGGPEVLARFVGAADEELDIIAAYKRLVGKLLGEDLFTEVPPTSCARSRAPRCAARADRSRTLRRAG